MFTYAGLGLRDERGGGGPNDPPPPGLGANDIEFYDQLPPGATIADGASAIGEAKAAVSRKEVCTRSNNGQPHNALCPCPRGCSS